MHTCDSLAGNALCGVYDDDEGELQGTYTADGITALCEGLKGSTVTSLKCAAAISSHPQLLAINSAICLHAVPVSMATSFAAPDAVTPTPPTA